MKKTNRIKIPILLVVTTLFIWWTFFTNIQNNQAASSDYPKRDYNQDTGSIYFYIGRSAQKRKDFKQALKAYDTALKLQPDRLEIYDRIEIIHKLQNK